MKETDLVIRYLQEHEEVTDLLFTGGDPMVMHSRVFGSYIDEIIKADIPHLKTIRIGTKSLSYWPYKFVNEADTEGMLNIFKKITDSGLHLAIMAHFNHPVEMKTESLAKAVENIRATGAQIRTQTPLLNHINNDSEALANMWRKQVDMGIIPYYLFLVRDTGAQDFFSVPLEDAWNIFRKAIQKTSGVVRTVRGPSMSADPGKIHVNGITEIKGEKVFVLSLIQGRNPDWAYTPFLRNMIRKQYGLTTWSQLLGKRNFSFKMSIQVSSAANC